MNRRTFIGLAGASTAAVATAGCLSGTLGSTGSGPEEMSVDDVENLNVETTDRNTIEVQGVGTVGTDPNSAELSVAVEAHDSDDATAVVGELATKSEQLVDALTEYGIPEDNVTTERYSLGEHSRRNRYEGEHRFRIQVENPDQVGEVIDLAADSGADELGRVSFTVTGDRREELYDEAVKRAVDDARSEAELFATAADVTLGDPVSIETSRSDFRPRRVGLTASDGAGGAPPTELEHGQVSVRATATIEYAFEASDGE